jgi:hypothetical protein
MKPERIKAMILCIIKNMEKPVLSREINKHFLKAFIILVLSREYTVK